MNKGLRNNHPNYLRRKLAVIQPGLQRAHLRGAPKSQMKKVQGTGRTAGKNHGSQPLERNNDLIEHKVIVNRD